MPRTYYDVLGVSENADAEAIRAAYRERAKETHPDQSDDPDAGERFQLVRRAKEVLTDPGERRRYDRLGHERYVGDAAAATSAGRGDRSDGGSAAGYKRRQRARRKRAEARREYRRRRREAREAAENRRRQRTASHAGAATNGEGPAWANAAAGASDRGGASGATAGADDGVGYRVTRSEPPGPRFTTATVGLAAVTFVLYPVLLGSALLPAFPPFVNVVVGICTLLLVTYVLSVPAAGVLVFGGWTLLAPALLVVTGVGLFTPVGFFVWAACWLPCTLAVANFTFLSA